ncbi:MAG: Uncharacterized protein G01um10143_838 [Parcubacteria group bacterium Gr01-1014_3]|nr:MAG: Uncharacterized protein G01um10143_838 [Parcubacteria group bacterium Gr01-1014_3]
MRRCAICGKGSLMAGTRKLLRGHYNPTNWTRKHPNLQKARLPSGESALICTKCMKKLHTKVIPAVVKPAVAKVAEPIKA